MENCMLIGRGTFRQVLSFFILLMALSLLQGNAIAQDWNQYPNSPIIKKYEKFELIIRADYQSIRQHIIQPWDNPNDAGKLNPFNPDYQNENGISLEAVFTSPTGIQHKVYGFYMEDWAYNGNLNNYYYDALTDSNQYKWRIRFSPNEVGNWSYSYTFYFSVQPSFKSYTSDGNFTCEESGHHGFLKVGPNNAYLQFDDGTSFFGIGENMGFASQFDFLGDNVSNSTKIAKYKAHRKLLPELSQNGGNYVRSFQLIMDYAFDFASAEQYFEGQKRCFETENFIEEAERAGIYLQFNIQDDTGFSKEWPFKWHDNPYYSIVDNPQDTTYSFFHTERVKTLWERKFRYIIARWGYSKNIACWELWNEPRNCKYWQTQSPGAVLTDSVIATWLIGRANYAVDLFKLDTINYGQHANFHPIMGSNNGDPFAEFMSVDSKSAIHLLSMHTYTSDRLGNFYYWVKLQQYEDPGTISPGRIKKPTNWGEINSGNADMNRCTDIEFHKKIWSTSMVGGFSTGMSWFYHHDHAYNRIAGYADIASFFKNEDMQEYGAFFPGRYPYKNLNAPEDREWEKMEKEGYDYPYMNSVYMVNNFKNRGMGWTSNPTHYWYNFQDSPNIVYCVDSIATLHGDRFVLPTDDDATNVAIYNGFSSTIEINGLNPDNWYKVEWYRTLKLKYIASSAYKANNEGQLFVETPQTGAGDIDPNDPYYPDYAFKFFEDLCGNDFPLLHNGWERVCGSVNYPISKYDKLVVGDFDGNGVDDILGFNLENRATFFKYENETFNNSYCCNNGSLIVWDSLTSYRDNMWVGDFDGDGLDEILCAKPSGHFLAVFEFDPLQKNFYKFCETNPNLSWEGMTGFNNFLIGDFDGDGKDEVLSANYAKQCVALFKFDATGKKFKKESDNSCNPDSWDSISSFTDYWWVGNFDASNDPPKGKKDEIIAFSFDPEVERLFEFNNQPEVNAFKELASQDFKYKDDHQLWNFVNSHPWSSYYDGNITVLDFDSDGVDEIMAGNKSISGFTEFSLQIDSAGFTNIAGNFKDEPQIADMPALKIENGLIQKFSDGTNDKLMIQMPCRNEYYVGLYQKNDTSGLINFPSPTASKLIDPVQIYPNPTSSLVEVESILPIIHYELYDFSGRKMKSDETNGLYYLKLNLNEMPQGLYILKLWFDEKSSAHKIMLIGQ
ncbi:MAG: T9SS type A sorting domain-containing protein [Bacteroidales bacterium]|nr:T9SS type A sorting domain-containing protein [Bacteroidales bacterium]MCF8455627.1 T9SS type A sorting domain-containing protein [Bacteroidales bacterium]